MSKVKILVNILICKLVKYILIRPKHKFNYYNFITTHNT